MKCSGINCPMQYPYDVKKCLCVDTCPYATTVPYTNAERIRAMSDEELARELARELALIAEWDRKQLQKAKSGPGLVEFMEHWLQQPAEED